MQNKKVFLSHSAEHLQHDYGTGWYGVVRMGPFADEQDANAAAFVISKAMRDVILEQTGIHPELIPDQKGSA